jgi:hypothetical protein
MKVFKHCQREENASWVTRTATKFDIDLLGYPTLSKRTDDCYAILDGQQRIAAFKIWNGAGWESQQLLCDVYEGLSERQEADLFDRLQEHTRVGTFDRYRVRVNAGRPTETAVEAAVRHVGLHTARQKAPGAIRAVASLVRVYEHANAATLEKTLRILRDTYGDLAMRGEIIEGFGLLCQRYNGAVEEDAVIARLSSTRGGLNGLLTLAEARRLQTGARKPDSIAAAAVEIFNQGKGGKKLAAWWKT